MNKIHERRDSRRLAYVRKVVVIKDERAWLCDLRDVSEGGCGILRPPGWNLVEANVVILAFVAHVGPMVTITARVAWADDGNVGFEYHELQRVPPDENFDLDTLRLPEDAL